MSLKTALTRFWDTFNDYIRLPVNAKYNILARRNGEFYTVPTVKVAGFIETDEQLALQQEQKESFATVFNQWQRFARMGSAMPDDPYNDEAYPSELNSWSYDATTDGVASTINSSSFIGFISNQRYNNYTLEVIVRSANSDDDYIGLVLAHAVDDAGNAHTLDVMRAMMGAAPMTIVKDRRVADVVIQNVYSGLKWPNGLVATGPLGGNQNNANWGWSSWPNGVRLKVTREDDTITIETSQINETTYYAPATVVLDLASDPNLAVFRGPQRYGYACHSQASSTWEVLKRAGERTMILDLRSLVRYDYVNDAWQPTQTNMPSLVANGDVLLNWLHHNPTTGTYYYLDNQANAIKV